MSEVQFWRSLALYLADCHAATAEGLPRSAAKSQRERLRSICEKAESAIRNEWSNAPLALYRDGRSDKRVLERLTEVTADPRYTLTDAGRAALEKSK